MLVNIFQTTQHHIPKAVIVTSFCGLLGYDTVLLVVTNISKHLQDINYALKMKTMYSFKMLVNTCKSTWYYSPEELSPLQRPKQFYESSCINSSGVVTLGAAATYGGAYSPLEPNIYQKAWESTQTSDKAANISRPSK
jgi:hypothetical protein